MKNYFSIGTFDLWVICFTLILSISSCSETNKNKLSSKVSDADPFKNTIVESQFFDLLGKEDHVIEGKEGTVVVIPEGSFIDKNGKAVEGNINFELAEALNLEDMLLSNLTTSSNGELLETDGMIFIEARSNGEKLSVNPSKPIYIQIPTSEKKAGMNVYEGIRDEKGNMNWVNPKKLKEYLIPFDIDELNFYPEGFELEVINGLPFRGHDSISSFLSDSLYYSFSIAQEIRAAKPINSAPNEPMFDSELTVVDGEYVEVSDTISEVVENALLDSLTDYSMTTEATKYCGIDPAIIQIIRNEKFENTLIATREFEQRLQTIFKSCRNDVLELYINNLDKNLYTVDSMAAALLGEGDLAKQFMKYAAERKTTIEKPNKHTALLAKFYSKKLKANKKALQKTYDKFYKALKKKEKKGDELVQEYRDVLIEREKQRMETYGFEWSSTGWINIDTGTVPKTWFPQPLNVTVIDGDYYDQTFCYVVYTSINSIYRLKTSDNTNFSVGNEVSNVMNMPKKESLVISLAYKDDKQFIAQQTFIPGKSDIKLSLTKTTKEEIRKLLKPFNKFGKANNIEKDLAYLEKLREEKLRREKLMQEEEFLRKLRDKVYACCAGDIKTGKELFERYCTSCHSPGVKKLVGPGLAGATTRYPMDFIIQFTRNSQKLIAEGDPRATEIYLENNMVLMPALPVTDEEIKKIFDYIDNFNNSKLQ